MLLNRELSVVRARLYHLINTVINLYETLITKLMSNIIKVQFQLENPFHITVSYSISKDKLPHEQLS